jgi:hypothetical protein
MTKIYIVNDEVHERCLGAFSSQENAERLIAACEFLGDKLVWTSYEVDESLSKLEILKEMRKNGERIYSLSTHGMILGTDIRWNSWWVNTLSAAMILDRESIEDMAHEYTINGKDCSRWATVKAHSEDEAIEIAEKIMVRL